MMHQDEQFERQLRQGLARLAAQDNRAIDPARVAGAIRRRARRRMCVGAAASAAVVAAIAVCLWHGRTQPHGHGPLTIVKSAPMSAPSPLPDALPPDVTRADLQARLQDYLRSIGDIRSAIVEKPEGADMSFALCGNMRRPQPEIRAGLESMFRQFDEVDVQLAGGDLVYSLVVRQRQTPVTP